MLRLKHQPGSDLLYVGCIIGFSRKAITASVISHDDNIFDIQT